MRRPVEDGLSFLMGAGAGLLAMYLLDPKSGKRRRRQLAAVTREAVESAGETIAPVVSGVAESASRFGRNIAETVSEYGHDAYDAGHDYFADTGKAISRRASKWGHGVSEQAGSLWKRGKRKIGWEPEESHFPVMSTAAGGAGLLAIGAGLFYFLDPAQGKARRHWVYDKTCALLNDAGDLFRKTGKHIANRAYGTYAETRSMFREDDPTNEQLEARVRSELGRDITNMSDMTVIANDGYITLIGTIPEHEIERAEACARSVRGVVEVNNQLRPRLAQSPTPSGGAPKM